MLSNEEIGKVVRADILRVLGQRADKIDRLSSTDLQFPEYSEFFDGAAKWLQGEGLIRLGRRQAYVRGGAVYSYAQLTAKGEGFLSAKDQGTLKAVREILAESFCDAAKDSLKAVILRAPEVIWTTYIAWTAGQP